MTSFGWSQLWTDTNDAPEQAQPAGRRQSQARSPRLKQVACRQDAAAVAGRAALSPRQSTGERREPNTASQSSQRQQDEAAPLDADEVQLLAVAKEGSNDAQENV